MTLSQKTKIASVLLSAAGLFRRLSDAWRFAGLKIGG